MRIKDFEELGTEDLDYVTEPEPESSNDPAIDYEIKLRKKFSEIKSQKIKKMSLFQTEFDGSNIIKKGQKAGIILEGKFTNSDNTEPEVKQYTVSLIKMIAAEALHRIPILKIFCFSEKISLKKFAKEIERYHFDALLKGNLELWHYKPEENICEMVENYPYERVNMHYNTDSTF
jgi:hypothetical protein